MYYTLQGNSLKPLTGLVAVGDVQKNAAFLTPEEAASVGAYPYDYNVPDTPKGRVARAVGYGLRDGEWHAVYEYDPVVYTEDDFNRALEDHLRAECQARGYDTREPTAYAQSSVPRWRQDAADWAAHVDAVMLYGLGVLNEWKRTGEAPSYDDFVAGLPRIAWTEEA